MNAIMTIRDVDGWLGNLRDRIRVNTREGLPVHDMLFLLDAIEWQKTDPQKQCFCNGEPAVSLNVEVE